MLVKDLRKSIEDVKSLLKSAGHARAIGALDEVTDALSTIDAQTVDKFVDCLERDVRPLVDTNAYAEQMSAAGLDEHAFLSVWSRLNADRALKKADLQKIARSYLGDFDKRASTDELKNDIKRGFYSRVYDRDAQAMANRATPW